MSCGGEKGGDSCPFPAHVRQLILRRASHEDVDRCPLLEPIGESCYDVLDACQCPSLSQCGGELALCQCCRLKVFAQVEQDASSAAERASLMGLVNDLMALGVAAMHLSTQTELFGDLPAAVSHRLANDAITIDGAADYG